MIVTDPENVEKNMNWILSVHSHHFTFPTIFIPLEIDFVLWSKKKDKISEESLDNNLYKTYNSSVLLKLKNTCRKTKWKKSIRI